MSYFYFGYPQTSNISRTLLGNEIVDHSDEVGASPVGAAPTTFSFSTQHLASMDWARTTAKTRRETFKILELVRLILEVWRCIYNFYAAAIVSGRKETWCRLVCLSVFFLLRVCWARRTTWRRIYPINYTHKSRLIVFAVVLCLLDLPLPTLIISLALCLEPALENIITMTS